MSKQEPLDETFQLAKGLAKVGVPDLKEAQENVNLRRLQKAASEDPLSKLECGLRAAVSNDPTSAGRFLKVISDSLEAYEEHMRAKRDRMADAALLGVLDPKSKKLRLVPFAIDAMVYLLPWGITGNLSPLEKECFAIFKEVAIPYFQNPENLKWLADTRDEHYMWWVKKYILNQETPYP